MKSAVPYNCSRTCQTGFTCNCRKDLEPGLHISRLGRQDFAQFFRLARTMTTFVRIKQVIVALALHVQRK